MYERHRGGSTTKTSPEGGQGGREWEGFLGKYFLCYFLDIWNVYVESNSKNFLFLGIF